MPEFAHVRVPGRIEVLGNHTDYNGGDVLVAPAASALEVSVRRTSEPGLRIDSIALGSVALTWEECALPRPGWEALVLGAVRAVIEKTRWCPDGLRIEIGGDLPVGSGLASSATVTTGVVRACLLLAGESTSPAEVATLAHWAEHVFGGVHCGWLDPWSVAHLDGPAWLHLSFRGAPRVVQRIAAPRGCCCVVLPTERSRRLGASPYGERRRECERAATLLGREWLCDATLSELEAGAARLGPILRRRALHVVGEQARVTAAVEALHVGNFAALGALLTASQASSLTNFENSSPEQDRAVRELCGDPNVLGARLTGGGFGGAVLALKRCA